MVIYVNYITTGTHLLYQTLLHYMCPALYVSCIICVLHYMCPALYVSCIICVLHYMCPALYVSCIICVLHYMCPALYVSIKQGFMQDNIIASHTCFGGHMDVNC